MFDPVRLGQRTSIPGSCQFWYTTALFWFVKVHQKVRKFATKLPKMPKFLVFYAKKDTSLKKTSPPVVAVVTNMSSEYHKADTTDISRESSTNLG